jgi:hypothetical protein
MCDYCDKTGHSIEKCFYNPENPYHQLPSKILHRLLVSTNGKVENSDAAVKSKKNHKVEIVGATIDSISVNAPKDFTSYIDSGATSHVFFNPRAFVPGSLKACDPRMISLAGKSEIRATHSAKSFCHLKMRTIAGPMFILCQISDSIWYRLAVLRTKESRRLFKGHALHSKFFSMDSRLDAVFVTIIPGFTVCWHLKCLKLCLLYL